MAIAENFIQALLERVNIADVIGAHVELKKHGREYVGLCPFHRERTPSFKVNPNKGFYHCFGCGAHDTAIGFLMEHLGAGFRDAVETLAQGVGMPIPRDEENHLAGARRSNQRQVAAELSAVLSGANEMFQGWLRQSDAAKNYLKSRGMTGEWAKHFGIGFCPDENDNLNAMADQHGRLAMVRSGLWAGYDEKGQDIVPAEAGAQRIERVRDRLRGRITFPIRNVHGMIVGFGGRIFDGPGAKYINSPETEIFHKGDELYGVYEARESIRKSSRVLVVEGYMDVIMLAQHGVRNVVAAMGTACSDGQVRKLFKLAGEIVFAFDGDAAGEQAAERAMDAALSQVEAERTVKFMFLPEKHDPDSLVREHGAGSFEALVEKALPLSSALTSRLSRGLNLQTAEGRALLEARAAQSLVKMQDNPVRRQIAAEIAALARVPFIAIADPEAPSRLRGGQSRVARPSHLPVVATDHAKTAMRILIEAPALALKQGEWKDLLCVESSPVRSLACWLEAKIENGGEVGFAALWEAMRAHDMLDAARSLGVQSPVDPADMAIAEADLLGCLGHLELEHISARSSELVEYLAGNPADASVLAELRGIGARRKEILDRRAA